MYVNPPFGTAGGQSSQGAFFRKCIEEYEAEHIVQAVVLLKAGVGYSWFKRVYEWPHCFAWERMAFVRDVRDAALSTNVADLAWGRRAHNPHGSVVVYLGQNVEKFAELFSRIGSVPGFNMWAYGKGEGE